MTAVQWARKPWRGFSAGVMCDVSLRKSRQSCHPIKWNGRKQICRGL